MSDPITLIETGPTDIPGVDYVNYDHTVYDILLEAIKSAAWHPEEGSEWVDGYAGQFVERAMNVLDQHFEVRFK